MHISRLDPTRHWRRGALLAIAGALLAACAASPPGASDAVPGGSANDRPTRTDAHADRVDSSSRAPVVGEVPADILEAILADAAAATGLDVGDIEVVRGESVTWPDGSLGCPERGMMYTQALVDGYQIVLDAGGEELDYRVGTSGGFRICEDSGTPSGG